MEYYAAAKKDQGCPFSIIIQSEERKMKKMGEARSRTLLRGCSTFFGERREIRIEIGGRDSQI